MNLKKTEAKILEAILEGAEFWCTCEDPDTSCAECPTYQEWHDAKEAMLEKLRSSSEFYGRTKWSLEERATTAYLNKYRAEKHYDKMKKKVAELVGGKR